VAHEPLVEDGVDRLAVVGGPVGQATDLGTWAGRGLAHPGRIAPSLLAAQRVDEFQLSPEAVL
jgi:hypothetical protein